MKIVSSLVTKLFSKYMTYLCRVLNITVMKTIRHIILYILKGLSVYRFFVSLSEISFDWDSNSSLILYCLQIKWMHQHFECVFLRSWIIWKHNIYIRDRLLQLAVYWVLYKPQGDMDVISKSFYCMKYYDNFYCCYVILTILSLCP